MARGKKPSAEYKVLQWKKVAAQRLCELFDGKEGRTDTGQLELVDALYRQVGQLQMELEWLKKIGPMSCAPNSYASLWSPSTPS